MPLRVGLSPLPPDDDVLPGSAGVSEAIFSVILCVCNVAAVAGRSSLYIIALLHGYLVPQAEK